MFSNIDTPSTPTCCAVVCISRSYSKGDMAAIWTSCTIHEVINVIVLVEANRAIDAHPSRS